MKTIHCISVIAVLLGASGLVTAEPTETNATPTERVTKIANKDDSKWKLAGLLGLMVLFGMRHDRHEGRDSDTP